MMMWKKHKKKKKNHVKESLLIGGGVLLAAGVLVALKKMRRTIPKNAEAVKPFDVEKYMGKWYEIARMDYMFEKHLDYATAEYSLNEDGTVKVVNRGYNYKKGREEEAEGVAEFVGSPDEAKLKVSFFGPFYAGYNVIAIDPKYKYALVAGRNLNYLWLMSRDTTMPDKVIDQYLQQAEEIGYDTSKLIWTKNS